MNNRKYKVGDRVYNADYGYGAILEPGPLRVHVRRDDGREGGAEVRQVIPEEQAKKKGSKSSFARPWIM
jgi:hypothetical protein